MAELNIYKPRYKIPFLAKSKVWPYKNSRLRRFFNIRGRKLIRGGLFKRYFMVFNNMKWSIARRYIRPYMHRRRAIRRRYRENFYTKQQLKIFYGKQKEMRFSKYFKMHLNNLTRRNLSFSASLERRADIILFRLRFLPTIYACQQYIHHYGLMINDRKEKSPYAMLTPGDVIAFEEPVWSLFFNYVWERVHWRNNGLYLWKARQYKILKKKIWYLKKDKRFKVQNVILLKKLFKLVSLTKNSIVQIQTVGALLQKKILTTGPQFVNKKNVFMMEYTKILDKFKFNIKIFLNKFADCYSEKWRFKKWKWEHYYSYFFQSLSLILMFLKTLKETHMELLFLEYSYYKWFSDLDFAIKIQEKKNEHRTVEKKYLEEPNILTKKLLKSQVKTAQFELEQLIKQKIKYGSALASAEEVSAKEYKLWLEKLMFFMNLILRRRVKMFSLKPRYGVNKKTNKIMLKKSKIKLYLTNQRKKNIKQIMIPRLKPVHWYIPNYIHFDFTILAGVYLYNPQPSEIQYSFKCGLNNVASFYRSRGF